MTASGSAQYASATANEFKYEDQKDGLLVICKNAATMQLLLDTLKSISVEIGGLRINVPSFGLHAVAAWQKSGSIPANSIFYQTNNVDSSKLRLLCVKTVLDSVIEKKSVKEIIETLKKTEGFDQFIEEERESLKRQITQEEEYTKGYRR